MVNSIQYDPNRTCPDRFVALCRRREAVHPGSGRVEGWATRWSAGRRPRRGGQLPAAFRRSRWVRRSTTSSCSRVAAVVLCRCAGTSATLWPGTPDWAQINAAQRRNPPRAGCLSGHDRADRQLATHGIVLGKAGRKRWLGRRPHVRGTAMNPIDHPHGGGEGRTKGGRHPVSPTGKPSQGWLHAEAT